MEKRIARSLSRRAGTSRARFSLLSLITGLLLISAHAAPSGRTGIVLDIDGAIGPATADYVARGLGEAKRRGAALVVLRMDTPGGLDTSMRKIIQGILASPVPVIGYVSPSGARAASAGTYILYATHLAAMAPGTNLGAATPVSIGGGLPFGGGEPERTKPEAGSSDSGSESRGEAVAPRNPEESKIVNDAVAYIRSLAELRGRNPDWAESAVRGAQSLSANQALKNDVINIVAVDMNDLLQQANGRAVQVNHNDATLDTNGLTLQTVAPSWRTRLLAAITNPNIAIILMSIGVYGLIIEFFNPGVLYPGTVGAICLLLGLYGLSALPVNYAGLALLVLGLGLVIAEAFVPSFGTLGIGGTVALVVGMMILIDTDAPAFRIAWPVMGGIAAGSLAFALLVVRAAIGSFRARVVSGREEMIGAQGEVQDWQGGEGHVFVHSERWNAVAQAPLMPGQRVRVASVDGLTLNVEPEEAQSG